MKMSFIFGDFVSKIPEFGQADLNNCELEPIHIPGSIQPHGVLLILSEPELKILQVSQNADFYFGEKAQNLLGQSLADLLTPEALSMVKQNHLSSSHLRDANPAPITLKTGQQYDGIFHRLDGLLYLELEEATLLAQETLFSLESRRALTKLQQTYNNLDLLDAATHQIKDLTGFDRVMLYLYDQDGNGEVVAETKNSNLESFLGLHYPASDIPAQARALYEKSWLRIIPDIDYRPSPILPALNEITGRTPDLSFSVLRSVSPIHCEYLRNMGVRASMSVSLLKDGKLCGLIACHHYSPKYIPHKVRMTCEFLGQALSWQMVTKEAGENNLKRANSAVANVQLVESMASHENFIQGIVQSGTKILEVVGADGAAIIYEDEIYLFGTTPTLEQVRELGFWIEAYDASGVFITNKLSEFYPGALDFRASGSGVMAIALSSTLRDHLIWFRKEAVETVKWAGNPKKTLEPSLDGMKLSPRKSFAIWKEDVQKKALHWESYNVEAAKEFRGSVLASIIRKVEEIKVLNQDLRVAIRARDDFMSVASHELRTPLTTMQLQLQLAHRMVAKEPEGSLAHKAAVKIFKAFQQGKRLEQLIEDLLDASRISSGKLRMNTTHLISLTDLGKTICERFQDEFDRIGAPLECHFEKDVVGRWDEMRLDQVITNLMSNALKYGDQKKVVFRIWKEDDRAAVSIQDQGIGVAPHSLGRIFERFERAVGDHAFKGLGLGLWITKQIVSDHGGSIRIESELGQGSTFIVELPIQKGGADET
jgi:two-component system, chemotaxis family, sensor kinase Cph1